MLHEALALIVLFFIASGALIFFKKDRNEARLEKNENIETPQERGKKFVRVYKTKYDYKCAKLLRAMRVATIGYAPSTEAPTSLFLVLYSMRIHDELNNKDSTHVGEYSFTKRIHTLSEVLSFEVTYVDPALRSLDGYYRVDKRDVVTQGDGRVNRLIY